MVAAKVANLEHGQKKEDAQICASSQQDAAILLNVSRRSVQHAAPVREHGEPELNAVAVLRRHLPSRGPLEARPIAGQGRTR
jgi:hypothetical protein